jgi:pyridoxal phosphate enzyme (YggS family)
MEREPLSTSVNDRDTLAALEEGLAEVRRRIAEAAERSGRRSEDVRLIAVTKQVGPETVAMAAAAGVEEFGENYVQDLEVKRQAAKDATWHFVGRLQRNKVRRVMEEADVIQTLEPGRSTDHLLELARESEARPRCLIEVDFTGRRVGVAPAELDAFAESLADTGIDLRGLMTVAPPGADPRPWFRRLRELGETLQERVDGPIELSMGMSNDLEVAVEEGATMVRVGTAIFGPRARR